MKTGKMNPEGVSSARGGISRPQAPAAAWAGYGPQEWRLPSGKALAEFAFESGFLAGFLLEPLTAGKGTVASGRQRDSLAESAGGGVSQPEGAAGLKGRPDRACKTVRCGEAQP